jgi:signal transduction histidine kinase
MPTSWTGPGFSALPSGLPESSIGNPSLGAGLEDEQFLLRAFRSFAQAATSLEHSYATLRAEVERLRRELESRNADLEATQAKLRREQALAEVSAVLAHEIRNPLGSLELFAGLLAEANLDSDCRGWIEHVQAGLRTLAATVNNVLQFHSLPEPECAPVDLGQLLQWARDFFLPLARQSRVAVSLQNRVEGIWFSADRHRLEQVLLNLVLNSLRAMPGGGWVELGGRTTPDGRAVVLTVIDTGPGISAEHLSHIFGPGFTTRAGSPGLGLAVCRKIVEQHGGTITAGDHTGAGAIFTVVFPLTEKCGEGTAE